MRPEKGYTMYCITNGQDTTYIVSLLDPAGWAVYGSRSIRVPVGEKSGTYLFRDDQEMEAHLEQAREFVSTHEGWELSLEAREVSSDEEYDWATTYGGMLERDTSFPLKEGYTLWVECLEEPGCTNGHYPAYELRDSEGNVVLSGVTCRCGRGCSNTDCIRDDWGDHDTVLEDFRTDVDTGRGEDN